MEETMGQLIVFGLKDLGRKFNFINNKYIQLVWTWIFVDEFEISNPYF